MYSGRGGIHLAVINCKLFSFFIYGNGLKILVFFKPYSTLSKKRSSALAIQIMPTKSGGKWEVNDMPKVKLWGSRRAEGKADPQGAALNTLTQDVSPSPPAAGLQRGRSSSGQRGCRAAASHPPQRKGLALLGSGAAASASAPAARVYFSLCSEQAAPGTVSWEDKIDANL